LQQVILNLALNARDAMPEGGTLAIETGTVELDPSHPRSHPDVRPGPYVLLAVRDTGCGMAEDVGARVFEPFFSTKGPGPGAGLGRPTASGIVRQAGGHVEVESQPGRGTTFKVFLPRAGAAGPAEAAPPAPPDAPRGSETVLLVEDEEAVRALTRRVLR